MKISRSQDAILQDPEGLPPHGISDDLVDGIVEWTMRILAELRDEIDAGEYQVDPVDDCKILCDRIQVSSASCRGVRHPDSWSRCLLTGATGFLGQWQLRYMLQMFPQISFSCIIRCDSVEDGWERLANTANGDYIVSEKNRVEIIPGDITKVNFGMDATKYHYLCSKIDTVVHTAANINLFTSYTKLRKVNVLSTIRMIEFCSTYQLKPLNFASTLGIFPAYFALWKGEYAGYSVDESLCPNPKELQEMFPHTAMGYPWTKWACEKILDRANSQGLPVTVFRYPLTCMCYATGHTQTDNVMIPLTLSAIQEGIIPRNFIMNANTPADICAMHSAAVMLTGATVSKTATSWLAAQVNNVTETLGLVDPERDQTRPETGAIETMHVLHMCDPVKLTGSKLAVWLSELGVPIDLVDDPSTLLEAAQCRGESSALKEIIHLTRSPVAKYWFGNSRSLEHTQILPISTAPSVQRIMHAWRLYKGGMIQKPTEVWPEPRELFKRSFLYMIKNNILKELSGAAIGQVLESGEEILQGLGTYPSGSIDLSHLSPGSPHGTSTVNNFSASIGGAYSVRNEAFAQAQSMTTNICKRAARGSHSYNASDSPEPTQHPLSTAGQLMMSMWQKYSGALAHDLMATTILDEPSQSPADQPPVMVIVSTDRVAAAALQTLLVEGTLQGTFKAPSLKECMPKSVRPGLAVELLEVHEALGILGIGYTAGAALMKAIKGADLDATDLANMATAPADDTLLLEMIPDDHSVPTIDCMLGLDSISLDEKWESRYAYHKQFLSRRDLYREGQVLVLSSPMHAMHIEELQRSYPNTYWVSIEKDCRAQWMEEAYTFCEVMERSQMNVEQYVDNWLTLHDEVDSCIRKLKKNSLVPADRHLVINSEDLNSAPFKVLNEVIGMLKPELAVVHEQLSVVPMIQMLVKYQTSRSRQQLLEIFRTIIPRQIVLNMMDFLFIGFDETGESYFRGNRLVNYGMESYKTWNAFLKTSRSHLSSASETLRSYKPW